MATGSVNLDVTQYVKVNAGYTSLILQAHRDDVRLTVSNAKPAKGNTAFHLLGGDDEPLTMSTVDANVWALGISLESSLIVTEERDSPSHRKYKSQDMDKGSTPKYFGFATPWGEWYILKLTDTGSRFVKGITGYEASWVNRANQAYDYSYNVF